MNRLIERHVESVPRITYAGTRKKLEGEIRHGMEVTWGLVLPQFKHRSNPPSKVLPPI